MNRSEGQPGQVIAAEEAARDWEDPRLVRALEEYRAALESGLPPERRAFEARYPDIGPALAECLDGLDFVHRAAANLSGTGAEPAADVPEVADALPGAAPLGDFRIIRQLGRGGMGVVYEAEQLSLGRRVALKVLPFAATLDGRQLQRFRTEATAAANLHHPHIVQVYAVGCERGVHYYAMQFIEGQTLAEVIEELRCEKRVEDGRSKVEDGGLKIAQTVQQQKPDDETRPSALPSSILHLPSSDFFRTVARLGIQAAEALEHAHSLGVVHRDIKPANLLVDVRGNLWITDFGLARLPTNAGLTLSSDVLGTLRYMSPEQALAK